MSNSFGKIFKIATYGESHGKAIGVIIDGCPSGIEISVEDIQKELDMICNFSFRNYTIPHHN